MIPTTTTYRQGDIVLIKYQFTDGSGSKKRPALIISNSVFNNKYNKSFIVPISSSVRNTLEEDEILIDGQILQNSELLKPSIIKSSVVFTYEHSLICRKIGNLPHATVKSVISNIEIYLGIRN